MKWSEMDYGTEVYWMDGDKKRTGIFRYPCSDIEAIVEEKGKCFRMPFKILKIKE